MAKSVLAILLFGCCACAVSSVNNRLREVYSWRQVDFAFPDQTTREAAVASGEYVPANNLPLGLEVWRDRLFVTVPRWKTGVVSSLNYVCLGSDSENRSPALIPYPNYEQNRLAHNATDRIVSVFRLSVDACDRLWLVDTGLSDIWGEANQLQAPKLMVFDLNTDTLIRQYTFRPDDTKPDSFLANIIADATRDTCDDAFAYIPDLGGYGLVVYSFAANTSWRVKHHYFHFDPLSGNFHVGGHNFQWTDGVFGVALSPVKEDGFRTLYFHPLSSTREFSVSTRVVQNASIASDSYYEYRVLGSRGPNTQASGSSLDENTGALFYTQVNKDGVGCWNSYRNADEYSADTNQLIASDSQTMEFPNDLKVDKTGTLWVLSDRMPEFLYKGGLDPNVTNYRIFNAPVADVIKGTVCDVSFEGVNWLSPLIHRHRRTSVHLCVYVRRKIHLVTIIIIVSRHSSQHYLYKQTENGETSRVVVPALGLLLVRRVVVERPAAGGVQLAAGRFRIPGPARQTGGHLQRRVRAGQQHAAGPGGLAGQTVRDGAPVEGRSGVHAQLRAARIGFEPERFAGAGAVPELRDEPAADAQTARRRSHRQHVPAERGPRVQPSVGDRHGPGERHQVRAAAAVGHRPEHGPGDQAVHRHREPDAARGQRAGHVVPRADRGLGRGRVRPVVRLPARPGLGPGGVQLPAERGVAAGTPLLLLRPGGHGVQHRRRPAGVAGRRVRRGAVRAARGRPPHAVLPLDVQHAHVLGEHAHAAGEQERLGDVRRVPAPRAPAGRHAVRLDGPGPGHRRGVLRARQPGRDRLLEPGPRRPPRARDHGRGGPGPGAAQLPGRRQGGRRVQRVGAQRPDAPVAVPLSRLRSGRRQLPRVQRARRRAGPGHGVRVRGPESPHDGPTDAAEIRRSRDRRTGIGPERMVQSERLNRRGTRGSSV